MFLRNKETLIKGFIIIISALIAAYILNDIINGLELRKISKINLIKIKSKFDENNLKEENKEEKNIINIYKEINLKEIKEDKNNLKEENKIEEKINNIKRSTIIPIINNHQINNYGPQIIQLSKIWRVQQENLSLCPEKPPNLKGKIDVDMSSPKLEEIEAKYKDMMPGGHWRPKECKSRNKVAIVVPYRDRKKHLLTFMNNIHRFLQRQQLDYAIFIVEQFGNFTFNKGRLTNIGVLEAIRVYPFDCILFHDVDTFPENDNNLYTCSSDLSKTKHMSVYIEKTGYKILYKDFIGGVLALTVEQLRKVNGYSNDFWGWGGEDDDLFTRVRLAKMSFTRPEGDIPRYRSFGHKIDEGNTPHPCRFKLLRLTKEKYLKDGLSNLNYRIESINFGKLYTHIMADVLVEEYNKWKNYTKTIGC